MLYNRDVFSLRGHTAVVAASLVLSIIALCCCLATANGELSASRTQAPPTVLRAAEPRKLEEFCPSQWGDHEFVSQSTFSRPALADGGVGDRRYDISFIMERISTPTCTGAWMFTVTPSPSVRARARVAMRPSPFMPGPAP